MSTAARPQVSRQSRFAGCLLGGAVGDALGYPIEFLGEPSIRSQYGPAGIQTLPRPALISDDTQMTLFTAAGQIYALSRGRAAAAPDLFLAYCEWLGTQGDTSRMDDPDNPRIFLYHRRELHACRAPGNTCLAALRTSPHGGTPEQPVNNSKGCGGVMRVAPIGLAGAAQTDRAYALRLAAEAAALTHGHPYGFLSAALLAAIIQDALDAPAGSRLETIVRQAAGEVRRLFSAWAETEPLCGTAEAAAALALDAGCSDLDGVHRFGEGWIGEEALYIAIFAAVRHQDDFGAAIRCAVNHRGDSDSTGSIAGNILGAWLGEEAVAAAFSLDDLELSSLIRDVALQLEAVSRPKPQPTPDMEQTGNPFRSPFSSTASTASAAPARPEVSFRGMRPEMAEPVPDYRPGSTVFGDWTVREALGAGSFGSVYRLEKEGYGFVTASALKVIRVPQSPSDIRAVLSEGLDEQSATAYFQGLVDEIAREISVMAALKSHPNIVSYEDHRVLPHAGSIGWDIQIRMELLTSLNDYLRAHPFTPQDVRELGLQLSSALEFCETKQLIHRDIKPENIFVSESGQFKLGDFGVARTAEKTTGGLSKKGTEAYMAPEVYLGRPYGPSVDLYSLGLVLYRLCNHNRLPLFPAWPEPITFQSREQALSRRMQGVPLPPPDQADPALAAVILRACAYDPKDRYHTAAELRQALASPPAPPASPDPPRFFTSPQPARPEIDFDKTAYVLPGQNPPPKPSPEPPRFTPPQPAWSEIDFDKTAYVLPGRKTPPPETPPEPEKPKPVEPEKPKPQEPEAPDIEPGPDGFVGRAEYRASVQTLTYRRNPDAKTAAVLETLSGEGKAVLWVTKKFAECCGSNPLTVSLTSGAFWSISGPAATAWLTKLLTVGSTVVIHCRYPGFPRYQEEITLHLVEPKLMQASNALLDGVANLVYVYGSGGKCSCQMRQLANFRPAPGIINAFSGGNPFLSLRNDVCVEHPIWVTTAISQLKTALQIPLPGSGGTITIPVLNKTGESGVPLAVTRLQREFTVHGRTELLPTGVWYQVILDVQSPVYAIWDRAAHQVIWAEDPAAFQHSDSHVSPDDVPELQKTGGGGTTSGPANPFYRFAVQK